MDKLSVVYTVGIVKGELEKELTSPLIVVKKEEDSYKKNLIPIRVDVVEEKDLPSLKMLLHQSVEELFIAYEKQKEEENKSEETGEENDSKELTEEEIEKVQEEVAELVEEIEEEIEEELVEKEETEDGEK